jgi:hypothetical protein
MSIDKNKLGPNYSSVKISSIFTREIKPRGKKHCHDCGQTFTPLKNAASNLTDFG